MPPVPIVIDTDIGADPDDAMALAFAVASPEVEVLGVTVVDGDVELRARMAARILGIMGRADIPVFLGERQPMGPGRGPTILGFEGRGLLDLPYSGPESLIDATAAVSWLFQRGQRQPYHLVAIGPLTNVATALRSHATLAGDLLGLTVSGGVFHEALFPQRAREDIRQRGIRVAWPDHNSTASDPDAVLLCARSAISITWITSEITFSVPLHRSTLQSLPVSSWVTQALLGMTDAWSVWWQRNTWTTDPEEDSALQSTSTFLHDPLAIASLFPNSWLQLESQALEYKIEDGVFRMYPTSCQEADAHANVSVSVDGRSFGREFLDRLMERLED